MTQATLMTLRLVMTIFQTTQRKRKLSGNHILPTTSCPFCHYRNDPINKGFHSCCGIDLQGSELAHLQQHGIEIAYDGSKYHEDSVLFQKTFWWLLVVAVTNSPKHDFNRCKSTTCKFLSRDTKSARDKNGTKPRKNKVKNTSLEISLVEYLCFVCKGTNLSLEKRGEIPISLIHNSFSYHCTPNVVIANGFDLKRLGLRKLGVKFCFALCWTFSKTRTGNRTKDLPPLLSNPWFGECLNDRHLTMLNFK